MDIVFRLEASIRASRSLEDITDKVAGYLEEAKPLLRRGAPDKAEGARIEWWGIDRQYLKLRIVSDRYVRAHDALLRIRKYLSEKLGREHKIGIRSLTVEKYLIEGIPRIDYSRASSIVERVATLQDMGEYYTIEFRNLSEKDIEDRVVDRIFSLLVAELKPKTVAFTEATEARLAPLGYTLKYTGGKQVKFNEDIAEWIVKMGWAKRYPGRGQWIFTAPITTLLNTVKSMIIEDILKPLGFEEWMLPKLTPLTVIAKMPGYLDHLAEGMIYCMVPPRREDALLDFKRDFTARKKIDVDLLRRELEGPLYVLEPAQCTPFYQFFSGEYIDLDEDLPVKVYDQSGWTWRWEGKGVRGLERTIEFYRLEAVWLTSRSEAVELRDRIADESYRLADSMLELEARLVVGAPFYMSSEEASKTYVDISKPEGYPTVDLEAWLPYRGNREESEWLEIGAYTCAKDKYVRSFNIREVKGREIWTGCAGFGLTRWITAFLAQHGFEYDEWPEEVKRRIGRLPKPPHTRSTRL
jgi:seryl-tRNA synthetase